MTGRQVNALQESIADALTAVEGARHAMRDAHGRECECTVCYALSDALAGMQDADHEATGLDDDVTDD